MITIKRLIPIPPITWNGSHLGTHPESVIQSSIMIDSVIVTTLLLDDKTILCSMKNTKDKISCIIDELKEIFHVTKNGTHTIVIGRKHFVITKVFADINNLPIIGPKLSLIEKTPEMDIIVRYTLAFRYLFTINATYEGNIRMYKIGDDYIALSTNESTLALERSTITNNLTEKILRKWFNEITVTQTIRDMLNYTGD